MHDLVKWYPKFLTNTSNQHTANLSSYLTFFPYKLMFNVSNVDHLSYSPRCNITVESKSQHPRALGSIPAIKSLSIQNVILNNELLGPW